MLVSTGLYINFLNILKKGKSQADGDTFTTKRITVKKGGGSPLRKPPLL
jgi:hypothetical protein